MEFLRDRGTPGRDRPAGWAFTAGKRLCLARVQSDISWPRRSRGYPTAREASTKTRVVEGHDAIGQIGPTIRRLRQEQGLSLRDLSSRTGLSTGFLSLAERGQSSLALTSLHTVATALGADMTEFLPSVASAEEHPLPHVSRAGERPDLAIAAAQRTYKLLSGRTPGRVFEPLLVTVYPSETIEEPYAHAGEEFAFVLSGEVCFFIDGTEYRLGPGDSIHFPSTTPHAIHNDTDEPVEAVWVLTPRLF